jgi:exosortase F-associated protein
MGLLVAIAGLAFSFLLQETDLLALICKCSFHPNMHFVVKKVVRVVINDFCLLLIIYVWFNNSMITRLAWNVQLMDTLILLPIYLILKLAIEGDSEKSSPLLSQLHRMIVNPTLMILIIPGVYFQRLRANK